MAGYQPTSLDPIQLAVPLMSQQLWCWGRDIIRPEGNWLIEQGFERIAPPDKSGGCPSVYKLELPDRRYVLLRGFGVFYADPKLGSVFLPRYEFLPCYRQQADLDRLPWTRDDLPEMHAPNPPQRHACAQLVSGCLDWMAEYETKIVNELGIDYRRASLHEWEADNRDTIPAEEMASNWRALSAWVSSNSNTFFMPTGFAGRLSTKKTKRSSRRPLKTRPRRAALPTALAYLSRTRSVTTR